MYHTTYPFIYRGFGLAIIALFAGSVIISPASGVLSINGLHNRFLDYFFVTLTNMGNGLILIPFLILLAYRHYYLSIGLLLSGLIEGLIVSLCKRILFPTVGRPMTILDESMVYFVPGVDVHHAMSFPSGHTVTVFGLCTFLALAYKNNLVTLGLLLFATLVGISRVYLLQHFLGDIAGGALIGTVVSLIIFHWIEQANKPQWMIHRFEFKTKLTKGKPRFS